MECKCRVGTCLNGNVLERTEGLDMYEVTGTRVTSLEERRQSQRSITRGQVLTFIVDELTRGGLILRSNGTVHRKAYVYKSLGE